MAVTAASLHVRVFVKKHPKIAFAGIATVFTALAAGLFWTGEKPSVSPFDELRKTLAERAQKGLDEEGEIPLGFLLENMELPRKGLSVSDPKLEEEIAYSIGRNNNVIWNRYLSAGKVPTDEETLQKIADGSYEIGLGQLFQ